VDESEPLPYPFGSAGDLGAADLDAVFGAVGELARIRTPLELRTDAVSILASIVPASLASWNEVVLKEGGADFEVAMLPDLAVQLTPERLAELNAAFGRHIGEHPAIRYLQRTGDGRPRTISDFMTPEEFHATALYQHFYSTLEIGAEDQLSLTLPQPEVVVGIAFNRPQRDFTARDRVVLNLIRPHIVQAFRNSVAFDRFASIISGLEEAVAYEQDGLILLDRLGLPEHLNDRARRLLAEYFGPGPDTRLPPELAEWVTGTDRSDGPPWPLVKGGSRGQLIVRRLPNDHGVALLLTVLPGRAATDDLRRVGLSGRQAEVMALVANGLSTKEVAVQLGISPRTVDKHVEQALRALGASTRLAAVNLLRQAEWDHRTRD
jgi:DNA-binding CsgD family transcriptional regulator/PAS domain-containing protein